jgi:hypothetical protein
MITESQRRFEIDYKFVRKAMLQGDLTKKQAHKWLKLRGHEVYSHAKIEIHTGRLHELLGRQSGPELLFMKRIHETEKYDGDNDE